MNTDLFSAKYAGNNCYRCGEYVYLHMRSGGSFIHERKNWPEFTYDYAAFAALLGEVRNRQGRLSGFMQKLGFKLSAEAMLHTLSNDVLKSTEIEGENLDVAQVRSSVARKLGMEVAGLVPSDRNVDGVVEMQLDATGNFLKPLTKTRLQAWHSALFPAGHNLNSKILVGKWRNDAEGPMMVLSGAIGKERVHFRAPAAKKVNKEMEHFLSWFNRHDKLDPVLKAALAHLWFLTVHPFDDGNGRIARALTDMQLCKADGHSQRFYSMSSQIRKERKAYYEMLEKTQRGDLDVTGWVVWFLNCLNKAVGSAEESLSVVLKKANFWEEHRSTPLNDRQRMMLNKLFDGFEGKLTSTKWAKMTKSSPDTALRDMTDLMNKKVLKKTEAGGRSTGYELNL